MAAGCALQAAREEDAAAQLLRFCAELCLEEFGAGLAIALVKDGLLKAAAERCLHLASSSQRFRQGRFNRVAMSGRVRAGFEHGAGNCLEGCMLFAPLRLFLTAELHYITLHYKLLMSTEPTGLMGRLSLSC